MRKVKGKLLIIFAVILIAIAAAMGVTFAVRGGGVSTSYAADSAFSVGAEGYDDFASAMDAAKTTYSATQKTVTMNADYALSSTYTLEEGYYVTFDLNGYTLDCSSLENAIDVYGTLTLQDGTDKYGTLTSGTVGVTRTSSGTKPYRTVYTTSSFSGAEANGMYDGDTTQSYKYYDSGAIIGCTESGAYAYYQVGTVRVLGDGTFNMYGGTITGANGYFGGVVNVCGTDAAGASYSPVFNMYGGSLSGNTCIANAAGVMVSYGGEANLTGGIIAHNKCTNSGSNGIAVSVTGAGSSLSLGEYKTGLDIKTPLVISDNSGGYASGVGVSEGAAVYIYDGTEISNNISTSSSAGGGAIGMTDGTVYMYGGNIIDNTAVNKGGAVYISGGTFVMSGGEVTFNGVSTSAYGYGSQPDYGGAFYVSGNFEMTGGTITTCVASVYGGAIYVAKSASAIMSGGTIMGCASYSGGGAVYVAGTGEFDMSGTADITLNSTSGTCGAGVFVESDATFNMSGGTIEKGIILTSSYGGVGVYADGTFTMTGGTIKDNSFTFMSGIGGGVYLSSSGTMYMYGGEIVENSALSSAGGIYVAGTLHVKGEVTVFGNTCGSENSNIYLINNKHITLDGPVTTGSSLGITFASGSQTQVTAAESSTTYYMQSYFYFSMDVSASGYMMGYGTGAYVEKIATTSLSYYVSVNGTARYCIGLEDALYLSSDTGCPVMLNAKIVTVASDVVVESGVNAVIDLCGKTLSFASGVRLEIYGGLTIRDSAASSSGNLSGVSEAECVDNGDGTFTTYYSTSSFSKAGLGSTTWHGYTSGAVTSASSDNGTGFVDVYGGGVFNLESGTLCGGYGRMAGIINLSGSSSSRAAFNMTGGAVSGSHSLYYGAIYATYGDVDISGGVLAANEGFTLSGTYSYLVSVMTLDKSSTAKISGGVISGNTALCAIYVVSGSKLTMSGDAEISGNAVYSSNGNETLGVVGCCDNSSFEMSGGRIVGNTVQAQGAVSLQGSVVCSVSGDAVVYYNYTESNPGIQCNICFYYGEETLSVERGFSGLIGVTTKEFESGDFGNMYARVALNSADLSAAEAGATIVSDEGCECVFPESDGYIYFYMYHENGAVKIDTTSVRGKITAGYVCSHCGADSGDYDGEFTYGLDFGTAKVYAIGADGKTYFAEIDYGIMVTTGEVSVWYPDAGSLNAEKGALGPCSELVLLADVDGVIEVYAEGVAIDLCGHALGGVKVTGGNAAIKDSEGGGVVYSAEVQGGTLSVSAARYYDNVLDYIDWTNYSCYVGTDEDEKKYYEVVGTSVPCDVVVAYSDGENDRTIYYETLLYAEDDGTFARDGAEVTLYADAAFLGGVTVSGTGVKINLRGNTLTADITIESDATLTITDENSAGEIGRGAIEGSISAEGELSIEGGTYRGDVFGYVDWSDSLAGYVAEGLSSYTVASPSVARSMASDAEVYATYAVNEKTVTVYYAGFADALGVIGRKEGATVKLLKDVATEICVTISADIEIDLAGRNLTATLIVSYGALTIKDSEEDGNSETGRVTGSISVEGEGSVILCGGTYAKDFFDEIYAVIQDADNIFVTVLNADEKTFTVMTDEAAGRYCKAYVTIDEKALYYEDFGMALDAVLGGGMLTLLDDIEYSEKTELSGGTEITIDLNGHVLRLTGEGIVIDAEVKREGEVVTYVGAKLLVTDSLSGKIYGTITIEGTNVDIYDESALDTDESLNPYKDTLRFEGKVSMNSELVVSVASLNDNPNSHTVYYFALTEDENGVSYYGITSKHTHIYNVPEWTLSDVGEISLIVLCGCGEIYGGYDEVGGYGKETKVFTVGVASSIVETGDGKVVYSGTCCPEIYEDTDVEGVMTPTLVEGRYFEYEFTVTPKIKITFGGDTIYYLEDEDAINTVLVESPVAVELWQSIEYVFVFSEGEISFDLGKCTLIGGIYLSGEAKLKLTSDGGAINGSLSFGGESSFETAEGSKVFILTCDISVADFSEVTISTQGGNMTGDITITGGTAAINLSGGDYNGTVSVSGDSEVAFVTGGGNITAEKATISGLGASLSISTNGADSSAWGGDLSSVVTATDGASLEISLEGGKMWGAILAESGASAKMTISAGDMEGKVAATGSGSEITVYMGEENSTDGGSIFGGIEISDGATAAIYTRGGDIYGGIALTGASAEISTSGGNIYGGIKLSGCTNVALTTGTGNTEGGIYIESSKVEISADCGNLEGGISVVSSEAEISTGGGRISGGIYVEGSVLSVATSGGDIYGDVSSDASELNLTLAGGTLDGSLFVMGAAASDFSFDLKSGTITGDVNVAQDASAKIDLNGGTIYGGIAIGAYRADGAFLEISATENHGRVCGEVTVFGGTLVVGGGTFESVGSGFLEYLLEGKTLAYDAGDGSYTVIDASGADEEYSAKAETAGGKYIYFSLLQDAVTFAAGDAGDVILLRDASGSVFVPSNSSVTIHLEGHGVAGDLTVRSGALLVITDSEEPAGTVTGSLTVIGTLEIEAGTYLQNVSRYVVSTYREERVLLAGMNDEYLMYTVTAKVDAEGGKAAASVTSGSVTVYYEDAAYAVSTVTGGSTLTLYKDSETGIAITSGSVTIDLNGHTLTGDVSAGSGVSLTIKSSGGECGAISGDITLGASCALGFGGGTHIEITGALTVEGDGSDINLGTDSFLSVEGGMKICGSYARMDLNGAELVLDGGLVVTDGADLTLDLDGGTLTGDVSVVSSSFVAVLVIDDSSADAGTGMGRINGDFNVEEGDAEISAGSYTADVREYLPGGYTAVIGRGRISYVISDELVEDNSAAYTEAEDSKGDTVRTYYTSVSAAVEYISDEGGTITLTADDASAGNVAISSEIRIDLNGHTLAVDFEIYADEGGSLAVYDSAYVGETAPSPITGTITVHGAGLDTGYDNGYDGTLLFTDGARPNGDLKIDISELDGSGCEGYFVGEKKEAGSGIYGITTGNTHIHNYNIETWVVDYDGRVTLTILCACGDSDPETATDDYIAKTVEITDNGDGTYTFRAEVIVGEGDNEMAYVCDKTVAFVATVVDVKGKTYYFETLQGAVDFVAGYDGCTITLRNDAEENLSVPSSATVTIDLGGKSITGDIEVNGGTLTIYGDGQVNGKISAEGDAKAFVRGGIYTDEGVLRYVDVGSGYVAIYTGDGLYEITAQDTAKTRAAASVTSDGDTVYYENLEDAVDALTDGATITLYADASYTYVNITVENVTLDLNGNGVGEIYVAESGSATITGEGFVDTVDAVGYLSIKGGSYDDEATAMTYVAAGYSVIVGTDGVYRVEDGKSAESAAEAVLKVTIYGEDTDLYFDSLQDALDYANVNAVDRVRLVNDSVGDIEADGDVTLDLNGNTLFGGVAVANSAAVIIEDETGGGMITGVIDAQAGSAVTLSGGSFADDSFLEFLTEEQTAYRNADGTFTAMSLYDALEKCGAYVTYEDKNTDEPVTVYCETMETAAEYAAANDGTITLNRDITWDQTISCGKITAVLDGHTLSAALVIEADSDEGLGHGANLTILGTGTIKGTVTVTGSGDTNEDDNSYRDAFVLSGGLTPGANLSVDLAELANSSNGGYFFSAYEDGSYKIATAKEHTSHAYDIEVWDVDGDGNAVLSFMCACGLFETNAYGERLSYVGDLTIDASDGEATYTYAAEDADGIPYSYTVTFAYDVCVELEGKTLYFESVYDALTYTSVYGGTAKLTEDVTEDVNIWDKGLTIDLNGYTLFTTLQILAGASLTICGAEGSGMVCEISSSGTLTLEGDITVTLTGDALGTERGRIILSGNISFNLGGHVFTGAPEITDGTTFTVSGGELYLVGDVALGEGAKMLVAGNTEVDVNGYVLTGRMEVEEGVTLTVTDTSSRNTGKAEGTIYVTEGAGLEIYRGCIDLADIRDEVLVVEVAGGYVFASLAQQDGSTYYKVMTRDEHEKLGHGYDIQSVDWDFNPETATLTLRFECLCGDSVVYSLYLSEDFYTTHVEFCGYEEVLPDGTTQSRQVAVSVELEYEISSSVVAENGVTYSFAASGSVSLPGFVEENDGRLVMDGEPWLTDEHGDYVLDEDGNLVLDLDKVTESTEGVGYRYTCIIEATCERTGEVIYEYGDGKGVIVRVTSGAYHRGIQLVTSETEGYEDLAGYDDRYDVYFCPKCGKIFVNSDDAVRDKGYDDLQDVVDDMDRSDAFEEEKDSIQDQLDEAMTGCMGEAGGSVSQSYEKAVDDLDDWEFEFDGGRTGSQKDEYLDRLMANIDAILEWATLEINKQEYATITEGQITELFNELLATRMYDETALRYEYDDILQCLDELVVETLEEIEAVYTAYLEKSLQDLRNLDLLPGLTLSSDTSDGGTEGEITIESTVAGLTKFVITRELVNVSLDDRIADGELVAANDTLEDDLDSYVDGKKVLAVYSVRLIDTVNDVELALFEGNYTVTIKLSSGLVGATGLQILYVGDDGRVEVYDTTLSEDGQYITFTTTHLSRYVLVGGDETDLTTMIYFFAILLDAELLAGLILLVVFLVMRSKNRPGKRSKKLASFAALALLATVVPAGGVTYTVLFAVGCVVLLVLDMLLVYGILNEKEKASLALDETREGGDDGEGDRVLRKDK